MSDEIDRAQERAEGFRCDALHRRKLRQASVPAATSPFCEDCGGVIGAARLLAVPAARRCIDCQELAERRAYLGRGA